MPADSPSKSADPGRPEPAGRVPGGAAGPRAGARCILVVDDDAHLLDVVQRMLDGAGFRVLVAASGAEALQRVAAEPVDLVLCDVLMPDREGLEICALLRKSHPGLPVIAMSGALRADAYLTMALKLGAVARLAKPFERDELLGIVQATLLGRA